MNKGIFTYSVLQYVPSQVLNERVNIGVLVFFPDNGSIHFIIPDGFSRLKGFFKAFKESNIRAYLNQIEKNIQRINKRDTLFENNFFEEESIKQLIDHEILKYDDSAFQFSSFYKSLLYTNDFTKVISDLKNQFFKEYEVKPTIKHITEEVIRKNIITEIKNTSPNLMKHFQTDFKVKTENNEFKFDLAWQNGSMNLIKPISFDLKETKKIQEKSVFVFGNLSLLSEIAKEKNYKFDLVIGKPQNKEVFTSFDRAIRTIDKANVTKDFIYADEINSYTQKAFQCFL